jgi:hypothetical protein
MATPHDKNVARSGYRHEFVFCTGLAVQRISTIKFLGSGECEKRVNSGKAYGAAIVVAYFAFSCTLFANLKALIF